MHFYAVIIWVSAHEAWESELALLILRNVHTICGGITHEALEGHSSVYTRRETELTPRGDSVISFLVEGTAFQDLGLHLHLIVSRPNLHFAVHSQDHDFIQSFIPANAHDGIEFNFIGLSPMRPAILRVEFLDAIGAGEPMISKSLRILQRLERIWPLTGL